MRTQTHTFWLLANVSNPLQLSADNHAFIAVGLVLPSASSSNVNQVCLLSAHICALSAPKGRLNCTAFAHAAQDQASWECVMHSVPAGTRGGGGDPLGADVIAPVRFSVFLPSEFRHF